MTRTEIKSQAKLIVAHHGAFTVLEFGAAEFLTSYGFNGTDADIAAIEDEAMTQANRVLDFLGL